MTYVQTGLQETCYTNYNGTYYSSFIFNSPYRYDFSGMNCKAANVLSVMYLDTSGACVSTNDGGMYATYSLSGTINADNTDDDSNGVSTDSLIVGIVVSFVGGVLLTGIAVYCWFKFSVKKPLGQQSDHFNNI
jgi:hypothetical protein